MPRTSGSDDYGSPSLRDPTSAFERIVREEAERANTFIQERAPEILNRPIGTKTLSDAEQLQDYMALRIDREKAGERVRLYINQFGENQGLRRFLDYAERMEKLWVELAKMGGD